MFHGGTMKKTALKALLLCAIVGLTASRTLSQPSRVPGVPILAQGDAVPGEYIVKLKSADEIGFLSEESVGRSVGGVVKTRFQSDPDLLVIKKDEAISEVYTQLYNNDLVE